MIADHSLWVAFAAGVVSFASPCVLPLMPGYISYLSGISLEEAQKLPRRAYLARIMFQALTFFAGFTAVFVALGLTATSIGSFFAGHLRLFQQVAGALIILFGLHMTGILRLSWLYREKRLAVNERPVGLARSFLLGMAFGFGWTPCVGPILFAVLAHAATKGHLLYGGVLLFSYSLGLGIPFILTGVALSFSVTLVSRAGRLLRILQVFAGIVLLVMGLMLLTGTFQGLANFLAGLTL